LKFVVNHIPKVQKNDLMIKKFKKNGQWIRAIGHSKRLEEARQYAAVEIYKQYRDQGFLKPIDYLFWVHFVFYAKKVHEPDLDNLPSMYLDAMQGVKLNGLVVAKILVDDKLNRHEDSRKIIEGDKIYNGNPRVEIEIGRYEDAW